MVIGDLYKRQQVAYLIIGERRYEAQFVERKEGMPVGIREQFVNLVRREERQAAEFLFGRVIEVDRRVMERIEVGLELFIVRLAQLRSCAVDIEDDVVEVLP